MENNITINNTNDIDLDKNNNNDDNLIIKNKLDTNKNVNKNKNKNNKNKKKDTTLIDEYNKYFSLYHLVNNKKNKSMVEYNKNTLIDKFSYSYYFWNDKKIQYKNDDSKYRFCDKQYKLIFTESKKYNILSQVYQNIENIKNNPLNPIFDKYNIKNYQHKFYFNQSDILYNYLKYNQFKDVIVN
jgi:hypothetical protein